MAERLSDKQEKTTQTVLEQAEVLCSEWVSVSGISAKDGFQFCRDGAVASIHGQRVRRVKHEAETCWGCGPCASVCPAGAVMTEPL